MLTKPRVFRLIPFIFIAILLVLPTSLIIASTNADNGSITIVKTTDPAGMSGDFEYLLDSPGNPQYLYEWGSQGSGEGQFEWTDSGMDIDDAGNVYVADESNHRIQKFDSNGTFLLMWGSFGVAEGEFNSPRDVIVDSDGYVYVVDSLNHRIQKFNSGGNFISTWGWGVATGAAEAQTCTSGCQAGISGNGEGQFTEPKGIAYFADNGFVYVVDKGNHRIETFDTSGSFQSEWGSFGDAEGQFKDPTGIAIGRYGGVYIADTSNYRVQEFGAGGDFVRAFGWGVTTGKNQFEVCSIACLPGLQGTGDGQFNNPLDVELDKAYYIYVTDGPNTIQKFNSYGSFMHKWGSPGTAGGEFNGVSAIAVDYFNNVYASDLNNFRIQKFLASSFMLNVVDAENDGIPDQITYDTPAGTYMITEYYDSDWFKPPQLSCVTTDAEIPAIDETRVTINLDPGEEVTCTYMNIFEQGQIIIEKDSNPADGTDFTYLWGDRDLPQEYFTWGERGSSIEQYNSPAGIAADSSGYVYIVDRDNHRIQKVDNTVREFVSIWGWGVLDGTDAYQVCTADCRAGKYGSGDGQFDWPNAITVDSADNVYVVDSNNHRIQKFDTAGNFLLKWGTQGTAEGQFQYPKWIAADSSNNIYVVDQGNYRVQKFDSSGNFIRAWGSQGSGDGQFASAEGITASILDKIYIADSTNNNIQVFDLDGNFLFKWGSPGAGVSQFSAPVGVASDNEGDVYVVDSGNDRIQKFDGDGNSLSEWGIVILMGNDKAYHPYGIGADPNNNILVTDKEQHQVVEYRVIMVKMDDAVPNDNDDVGPWWGYVDKTGQYKITELETEGWRLKSITCETNDTDDPPIVELPSVTINLDRDEEVTCTFYNTIYEDPVADFSADPTEGFGPLDVQFTYLATGDINSCTWNFGDGSTSNQCSDQLHTYTNPGKYTVSLTVSGPEGSDTKTEVDYIWVYEPPVAEFSADQTEGLAPLDVQFTNLSTGDYDTCSWTFGDGGTSDTCTDPLYTYQSTGVYTVTLNVSGVAGEDTESKVDYISVYEKPGAEFSGEPTEGIAPLDVQFTNLSSGDYDTCSWDFGDGGTSADCDDPLYTYAAGGVYTVTLTVSIPGGEDTETKPDYITVHDPAVADFSANPTEGVAPLLVSFTNLSTGDYDTCSWDFGDGGTSNECVDPQNTYSSKGVYDVSLTVTGDGGESTETKVDHITVYEQPVAGFSGEPTEGVASLDVQFTNLSEGDYDTCNWDFGDGGTSADCNDPLYTYTAGGVYTVTLTVSIPGGEDTENKPDYITVYDPAVAEFSAEPTGGLSPLDVQFTNLSSGDYDTCSWDFGDSSTSSDCNDPPHTYTNPGVYTVSLTVSGNGGENTETKVDYITVNENVFADFSADPTYGPAQLAVQFTNLSDGDYDTCSWDFGDGNTSNECDNPINTYINPGLYTVTLTASGIGGEDTMTKEDYITVYTPVEAVFSATPTEGRAPLHVTFTNLSTGDYDTCTWNFGDGTTYESCGKISYTYTVPGNYTVSLTVKGNGGEDVETKLDYIVVDPPLHYNYMPIILGNEMEAESMNLIQSVIILFTNWLS